MNLLFFIKQVLLFLWYTGPIIRDSVEEAEVKLNLMRGGEIR